MKKITFLLAIVLMYGCSVESTEEFNTLDAKVKAQNNEQLKFETPSLTCGTSTESSLELVITAGEKTGATGGFRVRWMTAEDYAANGWGDAEELQIDMCQQMFQVTGNSEEYALVAGQPFPFFLENYIEGTGESCDRALACGMEYVFKVQALNENGKDGLKSSDWSEVYFCSTAPCEVECTSGYMIGDKEFELISPSKNWGWAHQFNFDSESIGSETREIHHKNGSLGGEVTISFNNGVVEITEGEGVTITHLYISNLEPETTNAPGQFDKTQTYSGLNGDFWLMIKAEVCN
jgi:hypothetical protein